MEPALNHHQQYLIEEFAEAYLARRLARHDLLKRVLLITGSIPATASVLLALGCGDDSGVDQEPAGAPTIAGAPAPSPTASAGIGPSVSPTDPAIDAAPYYGSVRLLDQLGQTQLAVLAIYGGNDPVKGAILQGIGGGARVSRGLPGSPG